MIERVPPHSEEAEKGVLGSLLLEPDTAIFLCREHGVTEDWFYLPTHRMVYEGILEVSGKGRPVDLLTVTDHLRAIGLIDRLGGGIALNRLVDGTPTAAHIAHYLDIVKQNWQRRTAITEARTIERNAYDGTVQVSDTISAAVSSLSNLASARQTVTTEHLMAEHREMRNKARSGGQVGWQTPWEDINGLLYGLRAPHNLVVAAQTSTGKTALTLNMIMHYVSQGANVAVSENDMSRADIEARLVGMITGINPLIFQTKFWKTEDEILWEEGWRKLSKMPIYIEDRRMTMDETESWAMAEKARHGIDVYVFDFLQKTKRTEKEWRHSLREVVGDWSCRGCEIGKRMKAATISISQFSRSGNKEKDVTPPHPTLESLKETGEIENNADVVMLLSKKPGQPVSLFTGRNPIWDIDVDVAKQRNGPTGIVEMCLAIRTQRFVTRKEGEVQRDEFKYEEQKKH